MWFRCQMYSSLIILFSILADNGTASADRRPVDPPPVVELKVFEGQGETRTDITFSHNANFFLFTTLENARPMAKGRMPVAAPAFPVLTGSPVAGMAYLDRPSPAGYFIFPDLSVRHEGKYRLSFSLYEELKETKDADVEPPEGSPKLREKLLANPMAPRVHVQFRAEVKSKPFNVFSAKKFPGLSESTVLSRTVAEQGCRVRIRRDVRMRRRDKPTDGFHGDYDDDAYAQSDHYGSSSVPDRPRSISNSSIEISTPYGAAGRRQSMHEYFPQQCNYVPSPSSYQQPPPPAPLQSANNYGPHLNFGSSFSTPTFPHPQMPQPVQSYPQNTNTNTFQYPENVHSRQMSAPSQTYGYHQPIAALPAYTNYTNYTQPQIYTENPDYQPIEEHRRRSASVLQHQSNTTNQAMHNYVQQNAALQQSYYAPQQQLQPSPRTVTPTDTNGHGPPQLPPLRTDAFTKYVEPRCETKYGIKSPSDRFSQPILPSPSYAGGYDPFAAAIPQSTSVMPTPISGMRSAKREYGDVFETSHMNQPMNNGMRPATADQGRERQMDTDGSDYDDAYGSDLNTLKKTLIYKRADGSMQTRKCPSPIQGPG